jgi:hypothetical protein
MAVVAAQARGSTSTMTARTIRLAVRSTRRDLLATWRPKTQAAPAGQAVPRGHLIPEEQPEMVISHFRRFFA